MTKASQPKTAVFQWLALQRPIRAAMLFDCFRGDIGACLFGVDCVTLRDSQRGGDSGNAAFPRLVVRIAVLTAAGT